MNATTLDSLFFEQTSEFTLFVAEERFFNGIGKEFFLSYKDSKGYFDSGHKIDYFLKNGVFKYIYENIDPIGDLITNLFFKKKIAISEAINLIGKLFSANQQHASSPEFIDPIVLFENAVTKSVIGEITSLYKGSILKPKVILVLRDNNIERAKSLLGNCPHKTRICFLKNDGSKEESYVHNVGADDIPEFINLYSRQCFNSCGKTDTGILYNEEWAENSYIKLYSPYLLKVRSQLMMGKKLSIAEDLNNSISQLESIQSQTAYEYDRDLLLSFEGMGKLFRIFCNDFGGKDITRVIEIGDYLNNEIFKAHIYRYSHFIPGVGNDRKKASEYLLKAEEIFLDNNMEDHAIYCRNNRLLHSFYSHEVSVAQHDKITLAARNNVPGLVGMPILFNNAGVANLYNARFDQAIEQFDLAMQYNPQNDHKLGIMCNRLIATSLAGISIDEKEIHKIMTHAKTNLNNEKQYFLVSNNLANLAYICSKDKNISYDILYDSFFQKVMESTYYSENENLTKYLLKSMESKLSKKILPENAKVNIVNSSKRKNFIDIHRLNPEIYNAWL